MKSLFSLLAVLALGLLTTTLPAQQPSQQDAPTDLVKVCGPKNPPPCASAPRAISSPTPEYSDQARRAGYEGVGTLRVVVEPDGHPSHVRMITSLGMGLDEKAIEAVKRWKFEPAVQDGKAVPVEVTIEVSFHLYNKH